MIRFLRHTHACFEQDEEDSRDADEDMKDEDEAEEQAAAADEEGTAAGKDEGAAGEEEPRAGDDKVSSARTKDVCQVLCLKGHGACGRLALAYFFMTLIARSSIVVCLSSCAQEELKRGLLEQDEEMTEDKEEEAMETETKEAAPTEVKEEGEKREEESMETEVAADQVTGVCVCVCVCSGCVRVRTKKNVLFCSV